MQREEVRQKLLNTNLFKDNEYLDKYCELVETNECTLYDKSKVQRHHILPRCCFKLIGLKCDDSKKNLVNLLYKDHVLAHYYLSKCASDSKIYNHLFSALLFLIRDKDGFKEFDINNLDDYQETYEKFKASYFYDKEMNIKKSLKLKGIKRSKETCLQISLSNKGRKVKQSTRNKISKGMKGNKNRLGSHHNKESREKISLNNKNTLRPETSIKLKDKPKTETHKKHMSESHLGKKCSEEQKEKMKLSQSKRDPKTRAFKWVFVYDNKTFLGEVSLLEYLNSHGFKIGSTSLRNTLNGNINSRYYNELGKSIIKIRSDFKYKNENKN